jgi:hypothetical protein
MLHGKDYILSVKAKLSNFETKFSVQLDTERQPTR